MTSEKSWLTWSALPGLLKQSNRGLASKVVSRISSLLPQFLHNLAIRQRYFATFDDVKDARIPGFTAADFFNKPLPPPFTAPRNDRLHHF